MIDLGGLAAEMRDVKFCFTDSRGCAVYRAVQADLGRSVTIRCLPLVSLQSASEAEALFQRGAKGAAGLQHQNILQVYDYKSTPTANLLITEHVEGESLEDLLLRERRLTPRQAFQITWQLSEALEVAHQKGRIHRNLKPSEIFITSCGQVKLGGFEAAYVPDDPRDPYREDILLGNPLYIAPEQIQHETVTPSSDVYSLGTLLYLMLTGELPFSALRAFAVLYKKVHFDPPPPSKWDPSLTSEIDSLVLKLLCRAPEDRFLDMADVRAALTKWFEPTPEPLPNLNELIPRSYPFPIAIAYSAVSQDFEWITRFSRLIDLFEATLKYCSSIALLYAHQSAAARFTDEVLATLRRPSTGHWIRYLDIAARSEVSQSGLFQQLREAYLGRDSRAIRGLEAMQRGVEIRNREMHGATIREPEYQGLFEDLLEHVHQLLASLKFLANYPLARIRRLQFDGNALFVQYNKCMGSVPAFPIARDEVSQAVEENRLGILDPRQKAFLDLTPLISMRVCGICGDEEIVYYNGMPGSNNRRLRFLSYYKGHQFDEEMSSDPFAALGIQC